MRIGIIGVAVVGMAVLMGTSWGRTSGQEGQRGCTVTVEPGQSVQKAIDEAPEGAVVCLSEGNWQEDLVIEKNLTLQGAGISATLLSGTGEAEAIIQITNGVKAAISDLQISGSYYGVKAGERSQLELNRTRLTQNNDDGIEVEELAHVTIQDSELSNNGYGISLLPSAQLVLNHSQVVRNLFGGIYSSSAQLIIIHSTISENGPQAIGLRLMGESQATIEDSIFVSNGLKALWTEDSSEVLVRNTRFENNGSRDEPPSWFTDDGISISGNTHAVFENVVVSGSGQNGLELEDQALVSIKNSHLISNQWSGLHLQGRVVLVLEDTEVAHNQSSGLDIWGAKQVTLIRTHISQNGYNGIYLQGAATVLLIESTLREHPRCGIEAGQNFVFGWGNRFADNKEEHLCDVDHQRLSRQLPPNPHSRPYVRVPDDAPGLQEALDLVQDGGVIEVGPGVYNETLEIYELGVTLRGAGIQTQLSSEERDGPTITIFSSSSKEVHFQEWNIGPGRGVLIGGNVHVTLLKSRVFQHGDGLSITGDASVEVQDTVIEGNSLYYGGGLVIQDSARLIVRDSKIVRNSNGLITRCVYGRVCAPAIALLNTEVQNNGDDGLHISGNGAVLDIHHSAIQRNGSNGFYVDGGVQLTLIESIVSDNGGEGIYVFRQGPQLNLLGNRIYNNVGCGIRVFVGIEGQFNGGQNEIHNNGRRDLCPEELGFKPSSAPKLDFLVVPPPIGPSVAEVCPQGCPFTSIAAAVAAVSPQGVVQVRAGSYSERIVIGKSLTLRGEGPDNIVLKGPVIVIREEPINVTIEGLTIQEPHTVGLRLGGQGRITLRNLKVLNSRSAGISIEGSAWVQLDQVVISGSWADGLIVKGQATVEVSRSRIEGNGFPKVFEDWSCYDPIETCNGILVAEGAQLTIVDSVIMGNMDWGVAALKRRCGYDEDNFTGRVVFKGRNIIRDNNKSGNHKGQGNPGRHPWHWFWIPSGQVCLP